jgi:hypothetical protein
MGNVCVCHAGVIAQAPLDARARVKLVDLLLDHGIVGAPASAFALESIDSEQLPQVALMAWMTVTASSPGVRLLGSAAPGKWMGETFAAHPDDELVLKARTALWQGSLLDEGGFAYAAIRRPVDVTVMNVDGPGDYVLGKFFDVITIAGKGAPDGETFASSALAKALQRKLRVELACGASWF